MKYLPTLLFSIITLFHTNILEDQSAAFYQSDTVLSSFIINDVENSKSKPDIKIESDRVNEVITITSETEIRKLDIEIFNLLGKKVAQGSLIFHDKMVQFSVADLSSGVYILVAATQNGKRKSLKFVK